MKDATPHTKGLRSKKDCVIHIDMNGNMVTRVRVINHLNEVIKYEVVTDVGSLLIAYLDRTSSGHSSIYTKLYHSSWLEVIVSRESDGSLIEKKRVSL